MLNEPLPSFIVDREPPQTWRNRIAASLIEAACKVSDGSVGWIIMKTMWKAGWRPVAKAWVEEPEAERAA